MRPASADFSATSATPVPLDPDDFLFLPLGPPPDVAGSSGGVTGGSSGRDFALDLPTGGSSGGMYIIGLTPLCGWLGTGWNPGPGAAIQMVSLRLEPSPAYRLGGNIPAAILNILRAMPGLGDHGAWRNIQPAILRRRLMRLGPPVWVGIRLCARPAESGSSAWLLGPRGWPGPWQALRTRSRTSCRLCPWARARARACPPAVPCRPRDPTREFRRRLLRQRLRPRRRAAPLPV